MWTSRFFIFAARSLDREVQRTKKTGCHGLQDFIVPAGDKLSQDQKFGEIFSYIFRCVALVVGGRESLKRGLRNAAPLA